MRNFETSGGTSSLSPIAVASTQTCLTVVPPDTNFAAARWGGIGCYTPIWSPLVDIQIVKVTAHCLTIINGTLNVILHHSIDGEVAILTMDTDGELVEWDGAVDLSVGQNIYLACTPSVENPEFDLNMTGFIVQVWFSGPGGGGVLWCYNPPA